MERESVERGAWGVASLPSRCTLHALPSTLYALRPGKLAALLAGVLASLPAGCERKAPDLVPPTA
ncbi:MAG TPA: hypothetical protein VN829_12375, partial [Dongiaceae bacterium]|nr:hypothetical protein [Dongiaceae bacterium]